MTSGAALPDGELRAKLATLAAPDTAGRRNELLAMLREDGPLYRGRGSTEAERLRAFVMARLAQAGLADAMAAYVLEELETGTNPYTLAAAARAARAMSALPADAAALLEGAIARIRTIDDFVHLDVYPAPPGVAPTTAIAELIATLPCAGAAGASVIERLRAQAAEGSLLPDDALASLRQAESRREPGHCCCGDAPAPLDPQPLAQSTAPLRDVELQNQDSATARFSETFGGRPSLIAFFYTRCITPDKCSRTVSQLGQVHERLRKHRPASKAVVAGITYDPDYDLPHRLHRYGTDRGLVFGETCQLLRSTGPFAVIRDTLDLGVGYGGSTVNRHRIELILVDRAGQVSGWNTRRLWDAEAMASALMALDERAA